MKIEKQDLVIDGKNAILGRLVSYAVKQSLLGKKVAIVNCNDILVKGRYQNIVSEYNLFRRRGGHSLNGPFFPRIPERLVKRTARGMLNYKAGRGGEAFDRILCFNTVPKELESEKKQTPDSVKFVDKRAKGIKLSELAKII